MPEFLVLIFLYRGTVVFLKGSTQNYVDLVFALGI